MPQQHECSAAPFALWRDRNGVDVFTGIVVPNRESNDFFKLHDARGSLSGPSHKMHHIEVLSEFQHYDDSNVNFSKECTAVSIGVDMLPDSEESDFDVTAGGNVKLDIRSMDKVKIAVTGEHLGCPAVERFWVDVLSVTPFGMVTGVPCSTLHASNIGPEEGPIHFKVDSVIGAKRGCNW